MVVYQGLYRDMYHYPSSPGPGHAQALQYSPALTLSDHADLESFTGVDVSDADT